MMEPVGTSLYVYGGAWDWQDVASSNQSTAIGLSPSWIDTFQSQDDTYTYKKADNPSTTDGQTGYVQSSTKMAKQFAANGWGTWTQTFELRGLSAGQPIYDLLPS
jgi:hypothetical protein